MLLKYFNKDTGTLEDGVKVSTNRKTGKALSYIALPCWGCENSTCRHDAPCAIGCYAINDAKLYKAVDACRQYNFNLWKNSKDIYFGSIEQHCKTVSYFRWHESGDIINKNYFVDMIETIKKTPNCQHLCFTKKYEIVNDYIAAGGVIPGNLHLIFSCWVDWRPENPYKFPMTDVLPIGENLPQGGLLCGGNCSNCICAGVGCWQLQKNQTLYFVAHGAKKNQIKRGGSNA